MAVGHKVYLYWLVCMWYIERTGLSWLCKGRTRTGEKGHLLNDISNLHLVYLNRHDQVITNYKNIVPVHKVGQNTATRPD